MGNKLKDKLEPNTDIQQNILRKIITTAKLEYGGFELQALLGNIKKAYISITDNKLRILDIYKYTLADENI